MDKYGTGGMIMTHIHSYNIMQLATNIITVNVITNIHSYMQKLNRTEFLGNRTLVDTEASNMHWRHYNTYKHTDSCYCYHTTGFIQCSYIVSIILLVLTIVCTIHYCCVVYCQLVAIQLIWLCGLKNVFSNQIQLECLSLELYLTQT